MSIDVEYQREIARLRREVEAIKLDRDWEQQRRRYTGARQQVVEPEQSFSIVVALSVLVGVMGILLGLVNGIFWMAFLAPAIGVIACAVSHSRTRVYNAAKEAYLDQRWRLMREDQTSSALQHNEE